MWPLVLSLSTKMTHFDYGSLSKNTRRTSRGALFETMPGNGRQWPAQGFATVAELAQEMLWLTTMVGQ